jgi:putative NADH-flavin reductase
MKIAVFGAAGEVGRRIVAEAARRGHRVSAVTRAAPTPGAQPLGVTGIQRDVATADDLEALATGHDIVISALRPRDGDEEALVDLTAAVVNAARAAGTRFLVVGGAAPLRLPDRPEHTVLTAPGFLPDAVRPIATACQRQHDWILDRLGRLGAYLCPPAMLTPGQRTGAYRVGDGTLVTNHRGESRISLEDFAVALLDEAERPAHTGRRFTVGA